MGREDHSFLSDFRFAEIVTKNAAERPNEVAYTFLHDAENATSEPVLTYSDVDRRAKAIAATLRREGFTGERAVLLYPPGLDFVTAMFGCLCGETVAVPAYPPRAKTSDNARSETGPVQRLKAILADARPAVALTLTRLHPAAKEALEGTGIRIIATDGLPDAAADDWSDPHTAPDTLALLQYTSGSTASPKGVMITHGNLLSNCDSIGRAFRASPQTRLVLWLPPYHDMGLLAAVLMPMVGGFPAWLMAPASFIQKPLRWLAAISKYRATVSGGPNFSYDLCARSINEADRASLDLGSWKLAFSGAEPIDPATLDRFASTFADTGFQKDSFAPCYGLAEATLMVSAVVDQSQMTLHPVPESSSNSGNAPVINCGPLASQVSVTVVDPATQMPRLTGELGEIWVRSPGVAAGYWNNPQLTRETFHAHLATGEGPFLRTGDLGFMTENGLCIAGRLKDMIIVRGVKHFPQDIERTVQQNCPALRAGAGAAFTVPDEAGQEQIVIVQEVERTHRNADPAAMLASIRQSLSSGHGLEASSIMLIRPGQFPKTTSGKVQRRACRERFLNSEFEIVAMSHAPQTADRSIAVAGGQDSAGEALASDISLEEWLTQRLAAAVGVDVSEIDPGEPFARYGLDSLKGVGLAGEIADRVGHDVPAMALWDYPSITQLTTYLTQIPPQTKAA